MKNHLGETEYQTYAGWRAAVKKEVARRNDVALTIRWDGDKDICFAFAEDQRSGGKTIPVGEWTGDVGTIYAHQVKAGSPGEQVSCYVNCQ